jgi:hypothetical protein
MLCVLTSQRTARLVAIIYCRVGGRIDVVINETWKVRFEGLEEIVMLLKLNFRNDVALTIR